MLRVRFKTTSADDPRPVYWPLAHPYWITGYGEGCAVIVAYADDLEYVRRAWPEAFDLDPEEAEGYVFTDRFPRPAWFNPPPPPSVTPPRTTP